MRTTKLNIAALFLSSTLLFTSCESLKNANSTQKGVGIGAIAGGVLGAVIGNQLGHNGAAGAVLGSILGGAAGGIIGNRMDKQAKQIKDVLPGAEVERVGEGIKVVLNENSINFDFNKSSLTSTAKANLDKIAEVFIKNPDTNLNIHGHTDGVGSDAVNDKLSLSRANEVAKYFEGKGIAKGRFTTMGLGKKEPIAENTTEEGKAKNRRVEFIITANEKMKEEAQRQAN